MKTTALALDLALVLATTHTSLPSEVAKAYMSHYM